MFFIRRADWKAAEATYLRDHVPSRIVLHHTGRLSDAALTLEEKMQRLQNYSREFKGWSDVPYHYVIGPQGRIAEGRPENIVGDSNTAYDASGCLQIALEGNFELEEPTILQLESLQSLVALLRERYGIPEGGMKAHKNLASTACPGKNLQRYISQLFPSNPGR
jgi:hypothetical protein